MGLVSEFKKLDRIETFKESLQKTIDISEILSNDDFKRLILVLKNTYKIIEKQKIQVCENIKDNIDNIWIVPEKYNTEDLYIEYEDQLRIKFSTEFGLDLDFDTNKILTKRYLDTEIEAVKYVDISKNIIDYGFDDIIQSMIIPVVRKYSFLTNLECIEFIKNYQNVVNNEINLCKNNKKCIEVDLLRFLKEFNNKCNEILENLSVK